MPVTALDAATTTADAIGEIASHFMLDPATYARGAELGFDGMDFYVAGRAGVLGDAPADVVVASLVFFAPDGVRESWDRAAAVMPRRQAAEAFADCAHVWADAHLPDDLDAARLAELAGRVVDGADAALAPVFAGWRLLPVPAAPKARAVHHLNGLRELRFALHSAAVLSAGLAPLEALTFRSPYMVQIFGWAEPWPDDRLTESGASWHAAEAATNRRMAKALAVLPRDELDELVELVGSAHAASAAG